MTKVLLVANQTLTGDELAAFVKSRMEEGPCEFTLLVPATPHRAYGAPVAVAPPYAAGAPRDTDEDFALARRQLQVGLDQLRRIGANVDGDVGDPDPLLAINEMLAHRQVDEVVVSTLHPTVSRWLRQDLPHKLERKHHIPIRVITAAGHETR
jgi:hypothetical protein